MARVTVEDCTKNIPNRFKLVLVAGVRAKKLARGLAPYVKRDNDKNAVLALREIAADPVLAEEFKNDLIASMQKVHFDTGTSIDEDEIVDLEKDWSEQIAQLSRELESLGSVEENLEDHMQVDGDDAFDDGSGDDFDDESSEEEKI